MKILALILAFSLQPSAFADIIVISNTTPFPTVLSQINSNFAWVSANGGSNGGGGVFTNNYLLKSFGAGNDLAITNSFTLVNTNITGYTLLSVTVGGFSGLTNTGVVITNYFTGIVTTNSVSGTNNPINGNYVYDGDIGALTNDFGFILTLEDGTGNGTIMGQPAIPGGSDPTKIYAVIAQAGSTNVNLVYKQGTFTNSPYFSYPDGTNAEINYNCSGIEVFVPPGTNCCSYPMIPMYILTGHTLPTPDYSTFTMQGSNSFSGCGAPLEGYLPFIGGLYQMPTITFMHGYPPASYLTGFVPYFTNVFSSIPTNLTYVIWQMDATNMAAVVTYSTNSSLTWLNGMSETNNFVYAISSCGNSFTHTFTTYCGGVNVNGFNAIGCACDNYPTNRIHFWNETYP